MQTKSSPEDVQLYLTDASFIREGHAERVVFPESIDEVSEVLANANRDRIPVTVSGAGTGTVGGRVAFGGIVLATDKLNRIKSIVHQEVVVRRSRTGSDPVGSSARRGSGRPALSTGSDRAWMLYRRHCRH